MKEFNYVVREPLLEHLVKFTGFIFDTKTLILKDAHTNIEFGVGVKDVKCDDIIIKIDIDKFCQIFDAYIENDEENKNVMYIFKKNYTYSLAKINKNDGYGRLQISDIGLIRNSHKGYLI